MMWRSVMPAILSIALLGNAVPAQQAKDLRLERVVMLMRHGIRPPTKANPLPAGYTERKWPAWAVAPGLLTENGAKGAAMLGAGDRAYLVKLGLLPASGCPDATVVKVTASAKQRAIRTAESWIGALLPSCGVAVEHPAENGADPLFHGLDDKPAAFDGHQAWADALKRAPAGGIARDAERLRPELDLLQSVLGCCHTPVCPSSAASGVCGLADLPTAIAEAEHDRPDVTGPLDIGSTAGQTFLLEYLEGMPMSDVAWGQLTRAQIEQLLAFHPLKFNYSNRPAYVAARAGSPLAKAMVDAVAAPLGAPRVVAFVGHDTNLADLGGMFDLHWKVDSYPADDIPPGSAVGFEVWRSASGARFVRAFFRAQTMDQLRNLAKLGDTEQPFRSYLALKGCGTQPCPLRKFVDMARARIIPL